MKGKRHKKTLVTPWCIALFYINKNIIYCDLYTWKYLHVLLYSCQLVGKWNAVLYLKYVPLSSVVVIFVGFPFKILVARVKKNEIRKIHTL